MKKVLDSKGLRNVKVWRAKKEKAIIVALHGICSYSKIFHNFAKLANERGYTLSAIEIERYNLIKNTKPFLYRNLKNIDYVPKSLKGLNKPIFLLGYSLRTGYALLYYTLRKPKINGIILISPPVVVLPKIDRRISFYFLVYLVKYIFAGRKKLNIEKFFPRDIRSSMFGRMIILGLTKCRILDLEKILKLGLFLDGSLLLYASRVDLPTLIVQGTRDELLYFRSAYYLYERIRSKKKDLYFVRGGTHNLNDLLYEGKISERAKYVANKILDWIDSIIL
ncbi:alpha/beta hydrolase [Nanoarchaeota archaeon NZ13-N]|uniref:Serine aminopeptidase S33 domain-containing protein n=1 Tax=Candidatus Nanoclepta minutus TaxID=1940235 RepID=A0A397WPK1_9ARCH|nr:MAG: alpha/beta hydrolase [Nanoarchaeota archaeon NZ13-N]RIB35429.1 MAG: hypothetical protein BXU00_01530 [Candidatus Nanoclepta minutus]